MDRHTYTIREKFRRTEARHTETHIKTDRRTCIHIQSDKHSGERKGHIQTHTFRRTEGQAYICSQRNIQADRRDTYRHTHSDGQKGRHTYTIRETFRRTEGRHTETHIQTDRKTDI